ncbi:MAG TPA: DUF3106 domain-containing protein [Ramlibacter sp.]|nr:DUF3106 domain-containing protein [Ramlibacter sp.]
MPPGVNPLARIAACLALAAALAAGASVVMSQTPQRTPPASTTNARPQAPQKVVPAPISRPEWKELSGGQRVALAPLATSWDTLSEGHKRKWIVLAENFARLSPAERATLHSRMTEWAALSPHQRTQARLNFGETKQLSSDDKKAKWEAYQALSPEERRRLRASAAPRPPATAAAVKPVPQQKLANLRGLGPEGGGAPKQNRTPAPTSGDNAPKAQGAGPTSVAAPAPVTAEPTPSGPPGAANNP